MSTSSVSSAAGASPPSPPSRQLSPEEARAILWGQGIVHWLLRPHQKDLYDSVASCKEKIVVWNCSRRLGKSYSLCVLALEMCLKKPNAIVKYCCAKQVDAKNIIRPLIREIIKTCPFELKPEYKVAERAWVFPNGSRIELSGLDAGRADSIRGGSSDLAIIDEAGLVGDLKYIIRSVILPTTTTTKGKIILASTPPVSMDHEFMAFLNKARIQGNLITKTVYADLSMDKEELEKIIEECGGIDSNDFRREYKCEIIKDENKSVIPEFDDALKEKIVKTWSKPPFYDAYVGMDLGLKDLTVVLFAYYDFQAAKIIIEDEFVINGQKFTTVALAEGIRVKESQVFSDILTGEQRQPYLRVSDNNLLVINDLYQLHGIHFMPTRKDDRDAALNHMRILLAGQRIIINPKCKTLVAHLESATWNKQKTTYDRSSDNGHYDAVDALNYLVRNIQLNKNPYPNHYGRGSQENLYKQKKDEQYPQANQFKKIFNVKGK